MDIRKAQTLDEALQLYFSREKLDDDSYRCEACQKKVILVKEFCINVVFKSYVIPHVFFRHNV